MIWQVKIDFSSRHGNNNKTYPINKNYQEALKKILKINKKYI